LPNKSIEYLHLSSHTGLLGVIAAISTKQNVIFSKYKKGYLNSEDTIKFIRYLKRSNAGKKIALFLDNCSIHTAKKVKEFLNFKKIPFIFNLPYAPRFNGIERLWAQMKKRFRDDLAKLK
jgi:transposase